MTVSVCMGIYNGENYIWEQLESIRTQTRAPEEVILCDDGSTDGTRELVQKYLDEHAELAGWKLYCNEENRGYPANFYHAMRLCTKDIVFLADQDDIWDTRKIERMSGIMEQHEKISVLGCTFGLIGSDDEEIRTVMAPTTQRESGELREISVEQVFYKCEWPGMVLAYRNAWCQRHMGEKETDFAKGIPHDFLICAWAAEEKTFFQLEERLAWHRRHDNNAGGEEHRISRLLNKRRKLKEIEDYSRILGNFAQGDVMTTERGKEALAQKQKSMQGRYEALQSGRIGKVIRNAWRYRKEVRLATVVCDVVIVRQNR